MKTARKTGKIYEFAAETFLVKHGHAVLYKNYHTKFGEIDLITSFKGTIRFIEVKNVSWGTYKKGITPEKHVTREKYRRMCVIANYFLHVYGMSHAVCQIDLVAIVSHETINVNQSAKSFCYYENIHYE